VDLTLEQIKFVRVYVARAKSAGFSVQQIHDGLVRGGLSFEQATLALEAQRLVLEQTPAITETLISYVEVKEYVRQNRAKGFNDDQIRISLENSGVAEEKINSVLGEKKEVPFNKKPLFVGIIILLAIGFILLSGFFVSEIVGEVLQELGEQKVEGNLVQEPRCTYDMYGNIDLYNPYCVTWEEDGASVEEAKADAFSFRMIPASGNIVEGKSIFIYLTSSSVSSSNVSFIFEGDFITENNEKRGFVVLGQYNRSVSWKTKKGDAGTYSVKVIIKTKEGKKLYGESWKITVDPVQEEVRFEGYDEPEEIILPIEPVLDDVAPMAFSPGIDEPEEIIVAVEPVLDEPNISDFSLDDDEEIVIPVEPVLDEPEEIVIPVEPVLDEPEEIVIPVELVLDEPEEIVIPVELVLDEPEEIVVPIELVLDEPEEIVIPVEPVLDEPTVQEPYKRSDTDVSTDVDLIPDTEQQPGLFKKMWGWFTSLYVDEDYLGFCSYRGVSSSCVDLQDVTTVTQCKNYCSEQGGIYGETDSFFEYSIEVHPPSGDIVAGKDVTIKVISKDDVTISFDSPSVITRKNKRGNIVVVSSQLLLWHTMQKDVGTHFVDVIITDKKTKVIETVEITVL
jgi:hypothetical protein